MRILSILCGLVLLAAFSFAWGAATTRFKVFPYSIIQPVAQELYAFWVSDPNEPVISSAQKLESDNGGIPYRFLQRQALPFDAPPNRPTFEIDTGGVFIKGHHDPDIFPGYFLISGAFNFDQDKNVGTILISTDGRFIGGWPHQQYNDVNPTVDVARNKILVSGEYTVDWDCDISDLGRDLSLHNFGDGHHGATLAPDGTYWTLFENGLRQYDPDATGEDGKFGILR